MRQVARRSRLLTALRPALHGAALMPAAVWRHRSFARSPMSRFRNAVLATALLLALSASLAGAHEGNPNYRSVVNGISPPTDGVSAQVLDHDDALLVVNHSERDVTILDPRHKPYARLLADGTVQVNAHSSLAVGENAPHGEGADSADARLYASVTLLAHGDEEHGADPASSAAGEPGLDWVTIDRAGRHQWHDPRIKYRAQPVPPRVTDRSKETKVEDWRVPLVVAGEPGAILGTLTWVGEPGAGSSFPTAAVASLVVLVPLAVAAVVLVRRRRAGESAP
jgi:hypothetical protein